MTPLQRRKTVLILVHGFMSDRHCWDTLCRLFGEDARLQEQFEVDCFEYPTSLFGTGDEISRLRLRELAGLLLEYLALPRFSGRELVLMGHSQGGLVIQAYLVLLLEARQSKQLRHIRQAIFIATPNLGSIFLSRTRRVVDRVLKYVGQAFLHPQERLLRALEPEIIGIQKLLLDRIVAAAAGSDETWPVPIQCFYGARDRIVLEVSAQSFFSSEVCTALMAGHTDIVVPHDATDERYVRLRDGLLNPIGHANVFEVERYDTRLRVAPYAGEQGVNVRYGSNARKIFTDNRAVLTRTMTFSLKNRCRDICVIPYLTNPEGFVGPIPHELVETLALKERTRYEMHGREFNFTFIPNPGKTHEVTIEIFKGFDQGDRRIHFHLGCSSYYQTLAYTLDLSGYLQTGFRITQPPRLYFEDTEEHRCEHIWNSHSFEASSVEQEGLWHWEIYNVRQGAVGLSWDIGH